MPPAELLYLHGHVTFKDICSLMGIQKTRTTAYHPQGDGQVERQSRTLQEILSTFVAEHPNDWDLFVDQAVYAYNTSCHESTVVSPYELLFGRVARMPIEVDPGVPLRNPRSQSEYVQAVRKSILDSHSIANDNQLAAKKRQARAYDLGKRPWTPLEPGSMVWLRRPKKWKFGNKWVGPYAILSKMGVNYKIKSDHGKEMVVHHNQLKSCPLPSVGGCPIVPIPETPEISMLKDQPGDRQEQEEHRPPLGNIRPQNLRQVVNPPIRYGDYLVH